MGKFVFLAALLLSMMACVLSPEVTFVSLTPQAPKITATKQATQALPTEEAIVQLSAEEAMFTITSVGSADNGPTKPTVFTIEEAWLVTQIKTYHWNNGNGVTPGTIGLEANDGTLYGPWQATGAPGQGGVVDAYWLVDPQVTIPAGTYTVIDSDPETWAKNDTDTGGMGMAWGSGVRMGTP